MKKLTLSILLSALVSLPALAGDFYDYPETDDYTGRFYTGVDIASANYSGSIYPGATGFRLNAGYNITSLFAVEAGYAMMSSTNNSCDYGCGYGSGYGNGNGYYTPGYYNPGYGYAPPLNTYTFNSNSIQIALIANYPVGDEFSITAKVGFDNNTMSYDSTDNNGNALPTISDSRSNPLYGIGGQYNFGDGIIIRGQYEDLGYITTGVDMRMISLGGIFNF